MNIKKRLILSNTVTVIIPLILTIITALIFNFVASGIFSKDISFDNVRKLVSVRAELLETASDVSRRNPETIEDSGFQQYLAGKLSSLKGEVIITKNDSILFFSKEISKIDIEKSIVEGKKSSLDKKVSINKRDFAVEVVPIQFKDGNRGDVILLAQTENEEDLLVGFIITIVAMFIISFIAVNVFMSYLFSKQILKPVGVLKNAASEISNGNLNCEIAEDGDEEIRELCRDFEKMRIQLRDSVRMKAKYDDNRNMLVSSISHDLKTPITSIKGYVEGILDGVANSPEKMKNYLKTVYSKAELMDVMIDDLLLYSKLDLNQLPFNFEKTDIVEYFSYCILESSEELEKSNIKITLENNLNGIKHVMIDRERMRRVIMNIIGNSRKYMDKEEGELIIYLRETNSSIVVELRDNGSGIDRNDVNKIFDRFYRGDAARTETKGSGLGLAIARQIVEGHKGKIWAVSHDNEGTSIMISLAKAIER